MIEILFIGRDDDAETAVLAALDRVEYTVQRVRTVTEANDLLSKQRFDALVMDFDDASSGPGFDLAQLLGLFLFMPTIALMDEFAPEMAVQLVQFGAQDSLVKADLGRGHLSVAVQCAINRAHMAHFDSLTGLPTPSTSPGVTITNWRCCSSIWAGSSTSTTPWAMKPATRC